MKLLAIETSSDACSAALYLNDALHERFELAARRHSQLILPMVEQLLAEAGVKLAELDALAFGRGPGSFTGVRIAASVIQGIAFGAELPVVPVSTLAALAQSAHEAHGATHVAVASDARMNEVYWGAYLADGQGLMRLLGDERACAAEQAPLLPEHGWLGVGTGWQCYSAALRSRFPDVVVDAAERYPHARDIARLARADYERGLAVSAEFALPVYLRNEIAWKKSRS